MLHRFIFRRFVLAACLAGVGILASAAGCNSKSIADAEPAASSGSPSAQLPTSIATDNTGERAAGNSQGGVGGQATNTSPQTPAPPVRPEPTVAREDDTQNLIAQLQTNITAWEVGKPFDFQPVAARLGKRLESSHKLSDIQLSLKAAEVFMMAGAYEPARQVYAALEEAAAHSNNPRLAYEIREASKADLTRLNLLGTSPAIEGTLFTGGKFDWSKYRGKVVLIDFWATWCGPCLAELPNVKRAYEKYHRRGFDIVGISLDDERDRLAAFLEREKLPWVTLFNDDPTKQGWEGAAMTKQFNIHSIPATFLVDRAGKLVSISSHGEELERQLEKLLDQK